MWLKQSTAYTFRLGPFVDSTDGNTEENALTIAYTDVYLSKNGGAFAAKNDTTNLTGTGANGHYTCVLNATDTGTLGMFRVLCHVSGALVVYKDFVILPANVYDSLVSGSDNLQVDTVQVGGTTQTARDVGASVLLSNGTGAGQISLSSGTVTVGTNNDKTGYTVSTVSDKTGYSLSSAGVQAIWDALTSALTTVGSVGKRIVDYLDAAVSSRSTYAGTDTAGTTTLLGRVVGTIASGTHQPQSGDSYASLTGAQAEPTQGAPAANASVLSKVAFLYKAWRNKTEQTASQYSIYNDDAVTVDHKATFSDDGTTATRGEVASGP